MTGMQYDGGRDPLRQSGSRPRGMNAVGQKGQKGVRGKVVE